MARGTKNFEIATLLDHYGPVLTEKQRSILAQYYNDDLSLAEIAENQGITRQGVRDAIKHGETILQELEQKLGFASRYSEMQKDLAALCSLTKAIRCENAGLYTPSALVERDAGAALAVLERLERREEQGGSNGI